MPFYPDKLPEIAEKRGVTFEEIASMGGISTRRFQQVLSGELIPSTAQIIRLCDNLAIPYYALFSKSFQIVDPQILDFRGRAVKDLKYGKNAKSIYRNLMLQNFFADLYNRIDLEAPERLQSIDMDENPEQLAQSIRYELKLDNFQFDVDSSKNFYNLLRKNVQDLGVFVVQDHNISEKIDGFALYYANFTSNYIFINSSKRSEARKAFTLAHELAHILGKRSAISNDYESDNEVEDFCNRFAASLILPRGMLIDYAKARQLNFTDYDSAIESARVISSRFKCSISAALVRSHQVGLSNRNYYYDYAAGFGEPDHEDSEKIRQSGGPRDGPDQGAVAIAYLGERAAALIAMALEQNVTSKIEICQNTGLSKKRIDGIERKAKENGYKL